jgi:NAD-dependent dihydropyrimidine dehydrogenase PreA subunit
MIELVLAERCTGCGACVEVCPTDVFALNAAGFAEIARQADCQTCFMCELYCRADALYVAPRCDGPSPPDPAEARRAAGAFRRMSGWDEWQSDPAHANEHWRMEEVFLRARALSAAAVAPSAADR